MLKANFRDSLPKDEYCMSSVFLPRIGSVCGHKLCDEAICQHCIAREPELLHGTFRMSMWSEVALTRRKDRSRRSTAD